MLCHMLGGGGCIVIPRDILEQKSMKASQSLPLNASYQARNQMVKKFMVPGTFRLLDFFEIEVENGLYQTATIIRRNRTQQAVCVG